MSTRAARLAEALDPPKPLLEPRRIPRQVDIDERAERLQVQALAGGVGRDDKADLALLDRRLDVLALDRGEVVAAEYAALARAGVDADRLAGKRLRQLGCQRVRTVS